jgi:hypothetical protein
VVEGAKPLRAGQSKALTKYTSNNNQDRSPKKVSREFRKGRETILWKR